MDFKLCQFEWLVEVKLTGKLTFTEAHLMTFIRAHSVDLSACRQDKSVPVTATDLEQRSFNIPNQSRAFEYQLLTTSAKLALRVVAKAIHLTIACNQCGVKVATVHISWVASPITPDLCWCEQTLAL
jgi:hypothetical protein